jgi:WD40 repeat protein
MQSGEERWLPAGPATEDCQPNPEWAGILNDLSFLPDGRLLTIGLTGLRVFDLSSGESTRLRPCNPVVNVSVDSPWLALTPDARTALIAQVTFDTARTSELLAFDLETRAEKPIASHGSHVTFATLDPSGRLLVTGSGDGLVRVGPFGSDEEPHLLYGHSALVTSLAVSPDGKWIASAAEDGTIRLWPMPEGTPLHTLPYDELLAKLRSLTNLRIVSDPGSATGYKVEPGPFPGWAKFPEW